MNRLYDPLRGFNPLNVAGKASYAARQAFHDMLEDPSMMERRPKADYRGWGTIPHILDESFLINPYE